MPNKFSATLASYGKKRIFNKERFPMAETQAYMQDQDVKDFTRDIQQYHLGPLWEAIPAIMNKTPEPHAVAYLWKDELLKKKLLEAAEIFTPDRGGERRA